MMAEKSGVLVYSQIEGILDLVGYFLWISGITSKKDSIVGGGVFLLDHILHGIKRVKLKDTQLARSDHISVNSNFLTENYKENRYGTLERKWKKEKKWQS